MSEKINWTLHVEVNGGPKVTQSETIECEAYDKVELSLEPATTQNVEVQPSAVGQVQFLLITSTEYGSALKYKLYEADGVTLTTAKQLDGPHLLVGRGAVALLVEDPVKFQIENQLTDAATVQILVGRDATP
jgi:hypothetical protein